ncbi:MAG: flagellar biosynthesis protein FliQ [Rhodospirillaceae bacterium]|nr:flagellar biosynthesis protein FliQ [Rhodospirillaceae bacterium]
MSEAEILEIARDGIIVMIKIGAPVMVLALVVGLAISLVQALTQIQEMTLSFVPKMLVIFAALVLFLPFMLTTLVDFTQQLMDRIASAS